MNKSKSLKEIAAGIDGIISIRNRDILDQFGQPYNVAGAILYGGRVREESRPESDLDVFILTREKGEGDVDDFKERLERAFQIDLDVFQSGLYSSKKILKSIWYKSFLDNNHPYLLVTPFDNVRSKFEEIVRRGK